MIFSNKLKCFLPCFILISLLAVNSNAFLVSNESFATRQNQNEILQSNSSEITSKFISDEFGITVYTI